MQNLSLDHLVIPGMLLISSVLVLLIFGLWWQLHREKQLGQLTSRQLIELTDRPRTGVFQMRRHPDGKLENVFANAAMHRFRQSAHDPNQDLGMRGFLARVRPGDRDRLIAKIDIALISDQAFRESFGFTYPDNEEGWIALEATARKEPDGSTMWTGYLFDLSGERGLYIELNNQLNSKNQILAMAGHELRTPVQNVSLALELLDRLPLDGSARHALSHAQTAVQNLVEMTEDILELGVLESCSMIVRHAPLDLRSLVRSTAHSFDHRARQKGLTFEVIVHDRVPKWVNSDSTRIRQILHNLLSNAIKNTSQGSVRLHVDTEQEIADQSSSGPRRPDLHALNLRFQISDTGPGIAADKLQKIFEPFFTVGNQRPDSTGLGLSIVQRIVDSMGGRIWVESTQGVGSCFCFTLPLLSVDDADQHKEAIAAISDTDPVSISSAAHVSAQGIGKKLLIVDDDRLVLLMLGSMLRDSGYLVEECDNAQTALAMCRNESFDLLLTDFHMPVCNGLELALKVRDMASAEHPAPFLVAMTGGFDETSRVQAGKVFDGILNKPATVAQIEAMLGELTRVELQ